MDRPSARELVEAVRLFLGEAGPALEGRLAFHARVAANALAIVARELAGHPDTAERQALGTLAPNLAETATLGELRAAVGERLRDGRLDPEDAEVLRALADSVLARLAIDNPRYAGFARLEAWRSKMPG